MGFKRSLVVVAVLGAVLASAGAKANVDAGVQGWPDPQEGENKPLTVRDFDGWGMSWNWKTNYGVRDTLASRTVSSAKRLADKATSAVSESATVRFTKDLLGL